MSVYSVDITTEHDETLDGMRPAIRGTRHMAVSGHYLATMAAFQIFEAGGNAIDAGVAAGITLGVVQSDLVNVAGVAPIIIYLAERDEVVTISGLGTWPKAITPDYFQRHHDGAIPVGLLRTVVPAAPDAWIGALRRYGTMSFGEVAHAAIRLARDGFTMYPLMANMISTQAEGYARWPSSAEIYLPNGSPPAVGDNFVQADLARTLQYMVDEERGNASNGRETGLKAARDAFYKGDIAQAILRYHAENGGLLQAEDLAAFEATVEPPAKRPFGGADVYTCGPWCQGPALLQTLALLEPAELESLGHNSPAYVHTVVEALKLALADRERFYGDPRFVDVPIDDLLSDEYNARRRQDIRADEAWPGLPPAGDPAGVPHGKSPSSLVAEPGSPELVPLDTSYVCTSDAQGNVFSATPSDTSFDTPVIPGLGICPSSRGSQSWGDPNHASSVAPGKRPRLTPNPILVKAKDRYVMPMGTPGGDVQTQAMLQVLLNIVTFGMNPQAAVEAPRFATASFPNSFEPHAYTPGKLFVERRIDKSVGDKLTSLGHDITWWPRLVWRAGAVCLLMRDLNTGGMTGAADPRRPAYALGW